MLSASSQRYQTRHSTAPDRSLFVIDESDPAACETMCDYVMRLKKVPYASRFKVGHTTYKTSTYSDLLDNGSLRLEAIIDIPMPDNDEHFNFFEPEWNARMADIEEQWIYYVQTDHYELTHSGLRTIITPLKLRHFGARGWYCWASFIWSFPYSPVDTIGPQWPVAQPFLSPWPRSAQFFLPARPGRAAGHRNFSCPIGNVRSDFWGK